MEVATREDEWDSVWFISKDVVLTFSERKQRVTRKSINSREKKSLSENFDVNN